VPRSFPRAPARARTVIRALSIAAVVLSSGVGWPGCAARSDDALPGVLRPCREQRRVENYLLSEAQQCWYTSPNGRWRTLNHELHYDVLVVEAEATSFADAEEITRRFVEVHGGASEDFTSFTEILVYVQQEGAPVTSTIHRVRWSKSSGAYEVLEFEGSLQRR
jgi:hypothetical protein